MPKGVRLRDLAENKIKNNPPKCRISNSICVYICVSQILINIVLLNVYKTY